MTKPLEAVTVVIPVHNAADALGKILPGWRLVLEKTGRAAEASQAEAGEDGDPEQRDGWDTTDTGESGGGRSDERGGDRGNHDRTPAARHPEILGGDESDRGRRVGGYLRAQQQLVPGLFWIGGRVSTYEWHDPLRPDRDAISFGYVVAPELRPLDLGALRVEWEHEMNRLVGQRFRVVGLVTMRVGP